MPSHTRRFQTAPLQQGVLPKSPKSPSSFSPKETVPQTQPRNVQAIENVYEFFTKQRPLSWNYFSRLIYEPLVTTGQNFADTIPKSVSILTLDVNESLVVNHLQAQILYRPIPEGTAVADIKSGYYNSLDSPFIPLGRTIGAGLLDQIGFSYNLTSQESSLYDVQGYTDNQTASPFITTGLEPRGGFLRLNENVLLNGESSTSLFLFEPGFVNVEYTCIDSASGGPGQIPLSFLPYGLEESIVLASVRLNMLVAFDIRGHIINKNDAQLLRTLIQNN